MLSVFSNLVNSLPKNILVIEEAISENATNMNAAGSNIFNPTTLSANNKATITRTTGVTTPIPKLAKDFPTLMFPTLLTNLGVNHNKIAVNTKVRSNACIASDT